MKKLIILLIVVAVACVMGISALAAPGGFVESPSNNGAPTLVAEDSDVGVTVTAYRDRANKLSADQISAFENAYKSVVSYTDVSSMTPELPKVANKVKVDPADLAVSDLFFVTVEGKSSANASVQSNTFDNFIALVRYDGSGWSIVDSELKDGNTVSFTASSGVYAVVVSVGATPNQSQNGCVGPIGITVILCVVAVAIAAAVFVIVAKKKKWI